MVKVSDYSPDPSALVPREVGSFGPIFSLGDGIRVDAGWVVYQDPTTGTDTSLIAVNLTDGRRLHAVPPDGYWFDEAPRYITPTEMGVTVTDAFSRANRTMFRLAFDDLPTAP